MAATAALIAALSIIFALGYKIVRIEALTAFSTVPFSDAVKAGMDLKVQESDTLFTVGLILVGGLLGLLAAKPDEARVTLQDRPEIVMFLAAIVLVFSSMICHELYSDAVSEAYFRASQDRYTTADAQQLSPTTKLDAVPSDKSDPWFIESRITIQDLRDPSIEYLLRGQLVFVIFGLLVSACTLLSARFLKDEIPLKKI